MDNYIIKNIVDTTDLNSLKKYIIDIIDLNSLKKIIKDIVHTITIEMPKVVLPNSYQKHPTNHIYMKCVKVAQHSGSRPFDAIGQCFILQGCQDFFPLCSKQCGGFF